MIADRFIGDPVAAKVLHARVRHLVGWIGPLLADDESPVRRMALAELTAQWLMTLPQDERRGQLEAHKRVLDAMMAGKL